MRCPPALPRTRSPRSACALASQPHTGTRAAFLAAWTRLDPDQFGECYFHVRLPTSPTWEFLVGKNRDAKDRIIAIACDEPETANFLGALARAVANVEAGRHARAEHEVVRLLSHIGAPSFLHAMSDRARGLLDIAVLPALMKAANACAEVRDNTGTRGTAFLVRPDMVLTAAHVVLDDNGIQWLPILRPGLSFLFLDEANNFLGNRTPVAAGLQPPLSHAFPYASPPNLLEPDLMRQHPPPLAANALDFALVKLARPVTHLEPVDIGTPPPPPKNRHCFVMGFAGGAAFMFDADPIFEVHEPAGRLTNRTNAIAGFSGGCCVGADGQVVGIHEGSFTAQASHRGYVAGATYNRAVCLQDVCRMMNAGGTNPLLKQSVNVGLDSPGLVRALYVAGLRLGGPALEPQWRGNVCALMGMPAIPADGMDFPPFHPLFVRPQFQAWLQRAPRPDAERLCLIDGEAGTGKSFCVELIHQAIAAPEIDLVRLNATQTSAFSFEQAIAARFGGDRTGEADGSATRPAAGTLRHHTVDTLVTQLSMAFGKVRTATQPLYVAIDFEKSTGPRPERAPWQMFISALLRHTWARVVVIGLSQDETDDLLQQIDADPQTAGTQVHFATLPHLTVGDLQRFAKDLARDHQPPLTDAQRSADVAKMWATPKALRPASAAIQTSEAALFAIALRRFYG